MKAIQRREQSEFSQGGGHAPPLTEDLVPIQLSMAITASERADLIASILSKSSAPRLSLQANEFRGGPDANSKNAFRKSLLRELRKGWANETTEAHFIRLVEILQRDGCAVFAGLIDAAAFQKLIDDFTDIMSGSGTHAFLHSFSNLIAHPEFLKNPAYNDAVIHPLLISLLSYAMGGPVRMTDARGKDTQPISVNAQDNMLHVDNSPFVEEYKILLGWEKGQVKGPAGQNFTYLPGTQKGNRFVRVNDQSQPWSTENDSLFITNESIASVFEFQQAITGREPTVIEVEYPDQPITVVFNAGSLVHHRYRNKAGNTRSCVITAFHLSSDHPGALVGSSIDDSPGSVADILLGHQDGAQDGAFCSLIGAQASVIEVKISDMLNDDHHSVLVDAVDFSLSGERLSLWREIVVNAPFSTQLKFKEGNYISFADNLICRSLLIEKLASAMAYDKHGLLDLIIYKDGHEEIRKLARKGVWTMSKEMLLQALVAWLPAVEAHKFSPEDVLEPKILQHQASKIASLVRQGFPKLDFGAATGTKEQQQLVSTHQLVIDLGESITRCEKVETYVTTNLFLFLAISQAIPLLELSLGQIVAALSVDFLRAYIACVLVIEKEANV
ncbi:hypothetical protein HER10_EVM0008334 [Colletotrichum scovillei]|uniref:uncharacterized protein n=1 Tax=Colletotrichum scovillei TaxID=1209932 RepID=UPI0015C34A59|nr:uncharacterized protein HER10_EVM0008334 [Colletotrichum scovillei]KAF4784433.1 hypothetical protein HER10_EVM0008334 [Colletotrichum scovillei]